MFGLKIDLLKARIVFLVVLLLAVILGTGNAAFAAGSATTINLEKAEGSVTVTNAASRRMTTRDNMRLLSGYQISTAARSYAWFNLDSSKAEKLDANGRVEIRSSGSKLELMLRSGNLLSNVSKKLKKDEEMNVRTSTMVTGVRGTIVWVDEKGNGESEVGVLEGGVDTTTVDNKEVRVNAGEKATYTTVAKVDTDNPSTGVIKEILVEKEKLTIEDIPVTVLKEAVDNQDMANRINGSTTNNIDLSGLTEEEVNKKLEEEEKKTEEKQMIIDQEQNKQDQGSSTTENVFVEQGTEKTETTTTTTPSTSSGGGSSSGGGGSSTTTYSNVYIPKPGGGFKITPMGSYTASSEDGSYLIYRIPAGTDFGFTLDIESGYMTASNFGVRVNETAITLVSSQGTYAGRFTIPNKDCRFMVSGVVPAVCTVTLPASGTGYYVVPVSPEYHSGSTVAPDGTSGSSSSPTEYTFDLTPGTEMVFDVRPANYDGYELGSDFAAKGLGGSASVSIVPPDDSLNPSYARCTYTVPQTASDTIVISGIYSSEELIDVWVQLNNNFMYDYSTVGTYSGSYSSDSDSMTYSYRLKEGSTFGFSITTKENYIFKDNRAVSSLSERPSPTGGSGNSYTYSIEVVRGDDNFHEITVNKEMDGSGFPIEPEIYAFFSDKTAIDSSSGGSAFSYTLNLTPNKPSGTENADYVLMSSGNSPYGELTTWITTSDCIKHVKILGNIHPVNMKSWFDGSVFFSSSYDRLQVTGYEGLNLIDTSHVTDMSYLFDQNYHLVSLDLSSFDTSNVTDMKNMFNDCNVITSINLTNFDTSKVENMSDMFSGCSALATLDISNFNTSNVNNMDTMFGGSGSLQTIYVGDGFTTAKVSPETSMFYNCNELEGGSGTKYIEQASDNSDKVLYAHVDGGTSNPGYFTAAP